MTLEELNEQVRQYNEDPRVIAWRTAQEEKRQTDRSEAWQRYKADQKALYERVAAYNEEHQTTAPHGAD